MGFTVFGETICSSAIFYCVILFKVAGEPKTMSAVNVRDHKGATHAAHTCFYFINSPLERECSFVNVSIFYQNKLVSLECI